MSHQNQMIAICMINFINYARMHELCQEPVKQTLQKYARNLCTKLENIGLPFRLPL